MWLRSKYRFIDSQFRPAILKNPFEILVMFSVKSKAFFRVVDNVDRDVSRRKLFERCSSPDELAIEGAMR